MGLFDKKPSFSAMKIAVAATAAKISEKVQSVDVNDTIASAKEAAASIRERATEASKVALSATKEKIVITYESVSEDIRSFDYEELRRTSYYQEKYSQYSEIGSKKVSEYFRSTFEVDKSTLEMVDEVRSRLPVPAKTVDDIFDQCKREAMRRAISAFALNSVVQNIDSHSEAKYANLSESYSDFKERSGFSMIDDPNFAAMNNIRKEARNNWSQLQDGYNKEQPLDPYSADIEHVIAKKELYSDKLIRIGTTDDEFYSLINSKENMVFAESSFNRAMQESNIHDFLAARGRPDPTDPNLVHIDITQQDGLIKTVTVNKQDIDDAYDLADAKRNEHRVEAATEVGMTIAKTGAAMAAQQVVGLIVLETIDILTDEIRNFAVNGQVLNEDGWLQNTKDVTARVQQRLAERFEERKIWSRAKSLGIEAGVAGALSVIPQILISLIVKMPSFILALIRECTLSTVRCVRILAGNDTDKLGSIKIILAGATSAIVGLYAGRVIGNALSGVPLLNRFNTQITDILTGLLVTAVPLTAVYTFEKNKHKLGFVMSRFTGA